MGGNGTIGGGKSADLDFVIREKQNGPKKQKWEGTDPYVVSGNGTSMIRVTLLTSFTSKGGGVYEGELVDGDCVKLEWYPKNDPPLRRRRRGAKKRRRR